MDKGEPMSIDLSGRALAEADWAWARRRATELQIAYELSRDTVLKRLAENAKRRKRALVAASLPSAAGKGER